MSKESDLKRLQQLKDAKKRLRISDPANFDIDNEMRKINQSMLSNPANNVQGEEVGSAFDQETAGEQGEPFGQDLNQLEAQQQDQSQKQRVAEDVLRNEPKESDVPESGPQAEASKTPNPSPKTPKEEATPDLPGGLAKKPSRRGSGVEKAVEAAGGKAGGSDAVKQGTKQIASQAIAAAKKFVAEALVRLAASSPTIWIIIAGLVLVIIFFIVGLSYMGTINSTKPSTSGGTQLVAVKPKDDAGALLNLLKLSGDQSVTNQAINEALTSIKTDLLTTKALDDVKNNPDLVKQIDKALGALGVLEGKKTTENAKTFLAELKKVYEVTEGNIPVWDTAKAGLTVFPAKSITSSTAVVPNNALFGNSFLKPELGDSNVITTSDNNEKCDAVGINVTGGEAIYPIFGGTVVSDIIGDGASGKGKKVKITSLDGKYTALYAHISQPTKITKKADGTSESNPLVKGNTVTTTDAFGIAETNTIQIEIYYTDSSGSRCLVTTHADQIDHALSSRTSQAWGGYLWARIVKTFNLSSSQSI